MKRRDFIGNSSKATLLLSTGIGVPSGLKLTLNNRDFRNHERIVVKDIASSEALFPEKKRVPLGWRVFVVPAEGAPPVLYFPKVPIGGPIRFRITAAMDFREEKRVALFLPKSGKVLGEIVMIYAHPFQPFEIEISRKFLKEIAKQGIGLKLTGGSGDAWFYAHDGGITDNLGLQPHLLVGKTGNVPVSFEENLYSMNSFSPFGWMGGSVQDALYELALLGNKRAESTLNQHLSHYLDDDLGIVFENPHTIPLDGTFNSTEDFPAFVAITQLFPNHASIDQAISYIKEKIGGQQTLGEQTRFTTEGCYTLVYPMFAMGLQREDEDLILLGIQQILYRMRFLTDEKAIYQRGNVAGEQAYRNWGRGAVWYLLGLVKSLRLLRNTPYESAKGLSALKASFVRLAEMVKEHQDNKGMWRGYLDVPSAAVDTSTTAGIAAALVWGVAEGWLEPDYIQVGKRAYHGLLDYLTADGFLTSVSQINRGGEDLQRSDYRVISQFGMGLMAQLKAALAHV